MRSCETRRGAPRRLRALCGGVVFTMLTLATSVGPGAAQQRFAVLSEPGTPVVATEILVSTGPADEAGDRAGLAYLSARSLIAPLRPALDSLGARIGLVPEKDALSFSVIAAPDAWEEATRILATALFQDPPASAAVQRERREIITELRGRAANPGDAATRELDRAFFGASHPWGRPTVGTPQSVERLDFNDVAAFLRENFTPDRAYAVVVGPVDEIAARAHLISLMGSALPTPAEEIPYTSSALPVRREYNSITTWVSASFRVPEGGDLEALRFVAYLAADDLSFSPTQRSVFNVSMQMTHRVGGGEIRLQVVIPPEETDLWADRVHAAIRRLETQPLPEDLFDSHVRRYYGEQLMELIAPEARAHRAARQLLTSGRVVALLPNIEGMTQDRVRAAARSLDYPTIVLLGPTVGDD
jgi:predicted Zn-dependent peptidase